MTQEQTLNTAVNISYLMLKNGAEIYRVEDCVKYIAKAYGFEGESYAVLTSIIVTISDKDKPITATKRVNSRCTNLNKVSELNDLSRYISKNKPDYDTINKMLEEIKNEKGYNRWIIYLAHMFTAFCFALFFGGNIISAFIAAFVGAVLCAVLRFCNIMEINILFTNIISSAVISFVFIIIKKYFYDTDMAIMITSVIMILVPGLALTHCMRDLISSELVSGLSRLAEVVLTALGIAIGVFLVFTLMGVKIVLK